MEVETVPHRSPAMDEVDITDSPGLAVVDDDTDEAQPWFAGDMRRTACERAVAMAQHGDFLIRRSRSKATSGPSSFVLVVNNQVCVLCCVAARLVIQNCFHHARAIRITRTLGTTRHCARRKKGNTV